MCSPVWLRTCYKAELAERYYNTLAPVDNQYVIVAGKQILDDEALYGSYATNWTQFLLRVPSLTDSVQYTGDADLANIDIPEDIWDEPEEEYQRDLAEVDSVVVTIMFLVDEEAVKGGFIKILWLDCHGNCVWDNKIRPENMLTFAGSLHRGKYLREIADRFDCPQLSDHSAYERGFDFCFEKV